MRLRARLSAPVDTVWRALTDPAALRIWLAEHAAVELPHRYEFWGRHTPAGPRPQLSQVDGHTLRFEWLGTSVTIELEPDTIVTLTQTNLPPFGTGSGPLTLMPTFWALSLANLADYVEGRPLTGMGDFTTDTHRQEIPIAAGPAEVWRSLTDPATFRRWFGARMDLELWVGGRWAMGGFDLNSEPGTLWLSVEVAGVPDGMLHIGHEENRDVARR